MPRIHSLWAAALIACMMAATMPLRGDRSAVPLPTRITLSGAVPGSGPISAPT